MKSIPLQLVVLLSVHAGTIDSCPSNCRCDMETADCNSAQLSEPPEGHWPLVRVLDLTHNNITALQRSSFEGFPNVSVLYLSGNYIEKLDFSHFATLENLTYLSLWGNGLSSIELPAAGLRLPALRQLDLSKNELSELEPNLLATIAPNLQSLYFTDNPLFVLQDGPVLYHSELQYVSFQRTNMSTVTSQTFKYLPKLILLFLSYSEASNISGAFQDNPRLAFLDLMGCNVTELKPGTFADEAKLSYLSLDNNPLHQLDLDAVKRSMKRGGYLQISETPLACACGYKDVHMWALDMEVEMSASCKYRATGATKACLF